MRLKNIFFFQMYSNDLMNIFHWFVGQFLGTPGDFESADFESRRLAVDNKYIRFVQFATKFFKLDENLKKMNEYEHFNLLICFFIYNWRFSKGPLKTWTEAQRICSNNGGRLFEPRNLRQNTEVANVAKEISGGRWTSWWLGVNDKNKEGRFVWSSTKTEINFSNWHSGEPNNKGNCTVCEDCVDMLPTNGKWYDKDCGFFFNFACEFT